HLPDPDRDSAGLSRRDPAHQRPASPARSPSHLCGRIRRQAARHRRKARVPQGDGGIRPGPAGPGRSLQELSQEPGPLRVMKRQPKGAFHVASEAEIKEGQVSDVYFARTVQILNARGIRKRVKAEVRLKSFPQDDWTFGVLAGIEEVAGLLEGLPVDVWAMDEGTLFASHEPVLVIEGTYVEWAEYETALLGLL